MHFLKVIRIVTTTISVIPKWWPDKAKSSKTTSLIATSRLQGTWSTIRKQTQIWSIKSKLIIQRGTLEVEGKLSNYWSSSRSHHKVKSKILIWFSLTKHNKTLRGRPSCQLPWNQSFQEVLGLSSLASRAVQNSRKLLITKLLVSNRVRYNKRILFKNRSILIMLIRLS